MRQKVCQLSIPVGRSLHCSPPPPAAPAAQPHRCRCSCHSKHTAGCHSQAAGYCTAVAAGPAQLLPGWLVATNGQCCWLGAAVCGLPWSGGADLPGVQHRDVRGPFGFHPDCARGGQAHAFVARLDHHFHLRREARRGGSSGRVQAHGHGYMQAVVAQHQCCQAVQRMRAFVCMHQAHLAACHGAMQLVALQQGQNGSSQGVICLPLLCIKLSAKPPSASPWMLMHSGPQSHTQSGKPQLHLCFCCTALARQPPHLQLH